jgi:hypothetical protein
LPQEEIAFDFASRNHVTRPEARFYLEGAGFDEEK